MINFKSIIEEINLNKALSWFGFQLENQSGGIYELSLNDLPWYYFKNTKEELIIFNPKLLTFFNSYAFLKSFIPYTNEETLYKHLYEIKSSNEELPDPEIKTENYQIIKEAFNLFDISSIEEEFLNFHELKENIFTSKYLNNLFFSDGDLNIVSVAFRNNNKDILLFNRETNFALNNNPNAFIFDSPNDSNSKSIVISDNIYLLSKTITEIDFHSFLIILRTFGQNAFPDIERSLTFIPGYHFYLPYHNLKGLCFANHFLCEHISYHRPESTVSFIEKDDYTVKLSMNLSKKFFNQVKTTHLINSMHRYFKNQNKTDEQSMFPKDKDYSSFIKPSTIIESTENTKFITFEFPKNIVQLLACFAYLKENFSEPNLFQLHYHETN